MLPNSSCEIVLGSVVMETSGLYTCLVTGGDNPFKEDSNTKTVKVAGWYTTDIIPTNTINIPTNTTLLITPLNNMLIQSILHFM